METNNTYSKECIPHIGADGFWYVGEEFTGVRAAGSDGVTPQIGADGYWYIKDKNTGIKAVGEQGVKGEKGDQGDQGRTGATGPQGPIGPKGDPGVSGPQGQTGMTGPQGATGPKGDTGVAGPQGPQGIQGTKGDNGVQGLPGEIGPKGEKGDSGSVDICDDFKTAVKGQVLDAALGAQLNKEVISINSKLYEQKLLWSGKHYMSEGQNITLKEAISAQKEGIVLIWSRYDSAALDYGWNHHFISKKIVAEHSGTGNGFVLCSAGQLSIATKYLYISDKTIAGYKGNDTTPSNGFVLRYVLGK